MTGRVDLSAIIPVTGRYDNMEKLHFAYKKGLEATGRTHEFVYVLDGDYPEVLATLRTIKEQGDPIKIVKLARWFGESTALTLGFAQAEGDIVLTLPAFLQIEVGEIPKLVQSLDKSDMVIARRFPRLDSKLNVLQAKIFHLLLSPVTDVSFHDLGCAVRVMKRRVMEELTIYGDQHRFLPLLAHRQGFKVIEVNAAQAKEDAFQRIYAPGVYLRRILDILSIVFIIKFTKKPLRFFGLIGSFTLSIGALGTLYLGIERLFFGVPLGNRPILVLTVLMIVLGFQMIAVGLIGELIIFTHAKDVKEYTVDQVIE